MAAGEAAVLAVEGVRGVTGVRPVGATAALVEVDDAARALVKSPYLDTLKRLQLLEGNRLRGKVWQQVIERFGEDVVG